MDPNGKLDVYLGGMSDKSTEQVRSFARGRGSEDGNPVVYFGHNDVDEASQYIQANLKKGEPLNIIGHSYGADAAVRVARKSGKPVTNLIAVDPVGKAFGAFRSRSSRKRPSNVKHIRVVVNSRPPGEFDRGDLAEFVGKKVLGGAKLPVYREANADAFDTVEAHHGDFEAMMSNTPEDGGPSLIIVIDLSYIGD